MIESTLDGTLARKNPRREAHLAAVEKRVHQVAKGKPDAHACVARIRKFTLGSMAEAQDIFWMLIGLGTVHLNSDLRVEVASR